MISKIKKVMVLYAREELLRCGGKVADAANNLGVSRWTIYRLLKEDEEPQKYCYNLFQPKPELELDLNADRTPKLV